MLLLSLSMSIKPKESSAVSFAYKSIRIRKQNDKVAESIAEKFGLGIVTARVLAARGFKSDEDLKQFIAPSLREGLPEPYKLKNLNEACQLISEIQKSKQSIAICCDFDVDGLSGGAQVHHFFNVVGIKNKVFVPDRFEEGYGLNENMIHNIAEEGFSLVITIDYGTTNIKELLLAKSLGLKTIVIDHHHVGDNVPPCDVFINPNQKNCNFAGSILSAAGLAWYLVLGLKNYLDKSQKIDAKSYLDLACLGTICDMVPLIGANRVIAKRGLELMHKTTRAGLVALKNAVGITKEPSCTDISFGVGPRLNAAGRMVHGEVVIELLTTEDSEKAKKIAHSLNRLNAERQDAEISVKDRAVEKVKKLSSLPAGIVVFEEDFHTGVIGIVAQRLVEHFYRPSVVLGMDSQGIYKGSVRGIKGFSVVESLKAVGEHLIKYGGHEGAGGLSISPDKLEAFAEAFVKECEKRLRKLEVDPYVEADTEVDLAEFDLDVVKELKNLAPFGVGNPGPVLLTKKLRVVDVKILKNSHMKVMFSDGRRYLSGFIWRQVSHPSIAPGYVVNVAFRPDSNTFMGSTEIQANIQAVEINS
jgi:single-stranded-DNA-specific exonuclease